MVTDERLSHATDLYRQSCIRWIEAAGSDAEQKRVLIEAFLRARYPDIRSYNSVDINENDTALNFPGVPQEQAGAIAEEITRWFAAIDQQVEEHFSRLLNEDE